MKFKLKPLSVAMLATATVLSGCSSDNDNVDKTVLTQPAQTADNGFVETAVSGLTCKQPDIVQVIDSDFYPLTQSEKDALRAAVDPEGNWSAEQIADWNSPTSAAAYNYDYRGIDMYATFANSDGFTNAQGLTKEEAARQATAKVEAYEFKSNTQKQAALLGDDFDTWFETWFRTVSPTDYLGQSQRLQRAKRGFELSLSSTNDTQEVCYTPPTSCPNFQALDDSGEFDCITPLTNPLADDQPNGGRTQTVVEAGKARVYFKASDHVDGESGGPNDDVYKDVIIHAWNDADCTSYTDETVTAWAQGPVGNGIDPDYGMYWDLDLIDGHAECGNIIIFNKVDGDKGKKISSSDLRIPLGNEGSSYANLDKQSFFMEGVNALNYKGFLFANQHPLIGASAGSKSCGWGTELDEAGEACVGQVLEICPEGSIAVGVYIDPNDPSVGRQVEVASKCVAVFDPETAPDLYVRGAFHDADWGADADNLMSYAGNGIYQLNFAYKLDEPEATTDSHGFKVADAEWSESTNFGSIAGTDAPKVNGSAINLTVGEGVAQNITLGFDSDNIYQFVMDASKSEAPTLSVATVPVDAFPKISIGDQTIPLNYNGDGIYSVNKVQLTPSTYTIVIADEENNFSVGAGNESVLTDGNAVDLVDNGDALSYEVVTEGEYDFVLDLSDPSKPKLTAKPSVPYGSNRVFIRGTMTDWSDPAPAADELIYNADTSTYSVVYGLEAVSGSDAHNFKFASQAWGGPLDLGGDQFTFYQGDDALPLEGDGNIAVKPTKSTSYNFSISFAGSATGEVKVEEAPIYIRGGIYGDGSWSADPTMQLNFEPSDASKPTEAGHVYSSVVTTTGPGFFKVADQDWGGAFGFNYGASAEQEAAGTNAIQLGVPLQLTDGSDSKNISFQHPAGTYRFSFDDVTKQITVSRVE